MQLHVNPHELILVGENSFLRLSTDGSQTASTRCSHWRVLWSPAGAGHALFVESGVVGGVGVYSDSVPLVRFLQKEIEHLLYKPFGDASLPVLAATFEREGTPDLLVGQFGDGILWCYKNVGTNAQPQSAVGVKFKAGQKEGRVPTG